MPFSRPSITFGEVAANPEWSAAAVRLGNSGSPDGWQSHAVRVGTTKQPPNVRVSEANEYFLTSFNNAAWSALTPQEKELALAVADRWLGTLCWSAETDCCGRDFLDAWQMASAELALAMHQNPTAIIGGVSTAGGATGEVKRQQLGDLSIEFFQARAGQGPVVTTGKVGPKAPLILQRFPWLLDILSCWLHGSWGSSRILNRYRS